MIDAIAKTFRLAGWTPEESPAAEAAVVDLEHRIGKGVPATFRQILNLANGLDLLRKFSNCDQPIPCDELAGAKSRWHDYDALRHNLLPFMIENQGVCTWALPLDAGDDPHVLVEVDSGTPPVWETTAGSFSAWLSCQVEDAILRDACTFAAQAPELDDAGLQMLRCSFAEGQRTYAWPGRVNYRFSNADGKLLLWNWQGQCDWWISTAPDVSACDVLDKVRSLPGLADALYSLDHRGSTALGAWKQG